MSFYLFRSVLDISILILQVFLFLLYTESYFLHPFSIIFLDIVAYTVLFLTAPSRCSCTLLSPHFPSSVLTYLSVQKVVAWLGIMCELKTVYMVVFTLVIQMEIRITTIYTTYRSGLNLDWIRISVSCKQGLSGVPGIIWWRRENAQTSLDSIWLWVGLLVPLLVCWRQEYAQ